MALDALVKRLTEARDAGDDRRCLDILAEIEALDPENGRWAYARGVHLQALGRDAEAEAAYRQATEWRPAHAWSWTNLGRLLDDRCEWVEAIAAYDRSIALPQGAEDALTWTNRGNSLMSLGRFEEALHSFDRAIALDAGEAAARLGRNTVLGWTGRIAEANAAPAGRGQVVQLTRPLGDARLVVRWWIGRHTRPDLLERAARHMLDVVAGLADTPPGVADGVRVQWGWSALQVRRQGDDLVLCEPDFASDPWRESAWDVGFTLQTELMHSMTASLTDTAFCACRMQDEMWVVHDALHLREVVLHRRHATDANGLSGWVVGPPDRIAFDAALAEGRFEVIRTGDLARRRHALIKALGLPAGFTARFDAHAIGGVTGPDGKERFA